MELNIQSIELKYFQLEPIILKYEVFIFSEGKIFSEEQMVIKSTTSKPTMQEYLKSHV